MFPSGIILIGLLEFTKMSVSPCDLVSVTFDITLFGRFGSKHIGYILRNTGFFGNTNYHFFKMASRHCSISHFGVDVAPQIPTDSAPSNQVLSISEASWLNQKDWDAEESSVMWERGLTFRHSENSTFPFELFFPHTNRITSCCSANSRMRGIRFATCRQMVSK